MATNPENMPGPSKTTTLTALRSQAGDAAAMQIEPKTTMGFASMQSFELMQRGAKLLASSTLVPQQYQNNIANCVIALNMAQRIGADPLLVMQNLYVVHGRPGWSSQFLIATFNHCGRFSAIRYKWAGEEGKDTWSCQAYAKERDTGEDIVGPVITIALAKKEGWYSKSGSKWQSIPQLMLMYRAAAWLVRTHAPEIAMGLQTAEEIGDVYEARQGRNGGYSVDIEQLRQSAPAASIEVSARFTKESALAEIKAAGDLQVLDQTWNAIVDDYASSDREIEPEVDEAFKKAKADLQKQ